MFLSASSDQLKRGFLTPSVRVVLWSLAFRGSILRLDEKNFILYIFVYRLVYIKVFNKVDS